MPFDTSFNSPPPNIVTSGAMSFNRNIHGTSQSQASMSMFSHDDPSSMDMSQTTAVKIAAMQAKLNQKLGPEYISQRPGPGGGPKLVYAEGWKVINLANEVFGFNGWSSSIVSLTTDFLDCNEETKRYNVGVTAVVRVTLRDGVYHEDVGYGLLENSKSKGQALDKCKKEAVTDAVKRVLRNFGNLLGNCLYDRSYTQEVVKIKVTQPKFDPEHLHRRPEFTDVKPNIAPAGTTSASHATGPGASTARPQPNPPIQQAKNNTTSTPAIKTEPMNPSILPSHVHDQVRKTLTENSAISSKSSTSLGKTDSNTVRIAASAQHQQPTGLNTAQHPISHHPPSNQNVGSANQARKVAFNPEQSPLAGRPSAPPPAVSSDETLASYEDEAFDINSEDDAFYATVDLGEEDIGRPIDYDESAYGESYNEDHSRFGVQPQAPLQHCAQEHQGHQRAQSDKPGSMGPPPVPGSVRSSSRSAAIKAALASISSAASAPAQGSDQQQDGQQHNRPPAPNHDRPYDSAHISHQSTNVSEDDRENYNPNVDTSPSGATEKPSAPPVFSSGVGASSTPKRGGFSFPPEMVNKSRSAGPQVQSGVGAKRNVDAMRSSSSVATSRRPAQGMGLMGAQGGGSTRQPLDGLDVGDGGDAKRMRR
ncbi:dna repair and recombination protein rhm52 [Moniliophthora roreri]|uniref:Uncharacterized protein n=1 Tax=Moniliophthora roreri TaxID=221103 RepID=A0A0W0GAZ3_MONRR|nr:dna repair and recombination protein rhm52 [Moniliophthora roreri]